MDSPRPNIIICTCDQMRPFELGCYGGTWVRTPNIDALAARGVLFEHAITNNPLCMPARSSLLSGQYSRTCTGSLENFVESDSQGKPYMPLWASPERTRMPDPTLSEILHDADYHTRLIGKWHLHPEPGLLGFEEITYAGGEGRYTGAQYTNGEGRVWACDGLGPEYETQLAEQFLRNAPREPFFLSYNISPPHSPLDDMPDRFKAMYGSDEVVLRPNVREPDDSAYREWWLKTYLWDKAYYQDNEPYTRHLPDGFGLREVTAGYGGAISWADHLIGRLIDALHAEGLAERTILVFLGDHGDMLCSHGLFSKNFIYEESIRIPLIFYAPGRLDPMVDRQTVGSIIDVMPTLLELSELDVPSCVQGRSLAAALQGRPLPAEPSMSFVETDQHQIAVRTSTHLYGLELDDRRRPNGNGWFFDLRSDPYELDNGFARTERNAEVPYLREALLEWHEATPWHVLED